MDLSPLAGVSRRSARRLACAVATGAVAPTCRILSREWRGSSATYHAEVWEKAGANRQVAGWPCCRTSLFSVNGMTDRLLLVDTFY